MTDERREKLWQRMNAVVSYWTPIEPGTADYHMCQFFMLFQEIEELQEAIRIAELTMREDVRERSSAAEDDSGSPEEARNNQDHDLGC